MEKRCASAGNATKSLIPSRCASEEIMSQLRQYYENEAVSRLTETFKYKNVMEVPKLSKIVLNIGLGEAIHNMKLLDSAVEELKIISGQQPVVTRAKRSIAAFKLREGMPIGCSVILRRNRMYDFYYKLVNVTLARVRDFRGLSPKSFDGKGNYTLGIKEHIIFPEIDFDKIDKIKGLNISIVTTAKNDEEGRELLRLLGMPFRS